jgi:hypothetical protein
MGALSNSGRKAANLTGFYKGIQSAGAAIFWRLDGLKTPYDTMFAATVRRSSLDSPPSNLKKLVLTVTKQWGLVGGALVFAAPVIFLRIKDTVSVEEDLKFSDETVEDVAPARDVAVLNKDSGV